MKVHGWYVPMKNSLYAPHRWYLHFFSWLIYWVLMMQFVCRCLLDESATQRCFCFVVTDALWFKLRDWCTAITEQTQVNGGVGGVWRFRVCLSLSKCTFKLIVCEGDKYRCKQRGVQLQCVCFCPCCTCMSHLQCVNDGTRTHSRAFPPRHTRTHSQTVQLGGWSYFASESIRVNWSHCKMLPL